jgi:hypothetical protein
MPYIYAETHVHSDGAKTVQEYEVPFWSLEPNEVAVVLLVCKGVITLDEAHNILPNLSIEHLINEAQAWAIAGDVQN